MTTRSRAILDTLRARRNGDASAEADAPATVAQVEAALAAPELPAVAPLTKRQINRRRETERGHRLFAAPTVRSLVEHHAMCSRMREMKLSTVAKRNQISIRKRPFDLLHSLVEAGAVLTHRVPRKFFKGFFDGKEQGDFPS